MTHPAPAAETGPFSLDENVRMIAALRTDLNRARAQLHTQFQTTQLDGLDDAQEALGDVVAMLDVAIATLNRRKETH